MRDTRNNGQTTALALLLPVLIAGCARGLNTEAPPTEQLLAATGFQMRYADSPDRRHRLAAMTQQRLVVHPMGDDRRYVYADASLCECIYAGTPMAYTRFKRLAWYRRLASEQREVAQASDGDVMDWTLWGPWDSWY